MPKAPYHEVSKFDHQLNYTATTALWLGGRANFMLSVPTQNTSSDKGSVRNEMWRLPRCAEYGTAPICFKTTSNIFGGTKQFKLYIIYIIIVDKVLTATGAI